MEGRVLLLSDVLRRRTKPAPSESKGQYGGAHAMSLDRSSHKGGMGSMVVVHPKGDKGSKGSREEESDD
jgi:hypothetical protein